MSDNSVTGAIYASFMEEIKWRMTEIDRRLEWVRDNPEQKVAILEVEFCYLQLRFVCELIALASLVAHHSYGLKKELLKEWHADEIFVALEQVNEHCFPNPIRLATNGGVKQLLDNPEKAMTRFQLKEIYGKCGNALHRGVLKHALAGKQKVYSVNELDGWVRSVAGLIFEHTILFPQGQAAVLVTLYGGRNGEVVVFQLAADGPFWKRPPGPASPSKAAAKPHRPREGQQS